MIITSIYYLINLITAILLIIMVLKNTQLTKTNKILQEHLDTRTMNGLTPIQRDALTRTLTNFVNVKNVVVGSMYGRGAKYVLMNGKMTRYVPVTFYGEGGGSTNWGNPVHFETVDRLCLDILQYFDESNLGYMYKIQEKIEKLQGSDRDKIIMDSTIKELDELKTIMNSYL